MAQRILCIRVLLGCAVIWYLQEICAVVASFNKGWPTFRVSAELTGEEMGGWDHFWWMFTFGVLLAARSDRDLLLACITLLWLLK